MKKIVILIGSFCYNRGSEALVRGTIDIVKRAESNSEIVLCSGEEEFGSHLNIPFVDKYVRRQSYYSGFSMNRLFVNLYRKVLRSTDKADDIKYKELIRQCKDADLVIVSGGDNYDKSYHMFELMNSVNRAIHRNSKAKMVMYDCSLAAEDIDSDIQKDFALFDVVTAREKLTYGELKKIIPDVPIHYYPDPAFVMQKEEIPFPDGFEEGNTIGVNVSSMVTEKQYGSDHSSVIRAYENMIQWILDNTAHKVMLLPHVMKDLDLKVLRILYKNFKDNSRVLLVENEKLNAIQLKYLISKCILYVGARTHSTIAAYSSCVPTLVVGYSIKSKGIAKDLFGTEEGYVISVSELENEDALKAAFVYIYQNKESIQEHLKMIMPDYIERAWETSELFKEMLQG